MTTLSPEQLSSESYRIIFDLYKIFKFWYDFPPRHTLPELIELKGFVLSGPIPKLIYSRVRDLSLFHSFIGIFVPYQIRDFDKIFGFSRRSMNRLSNNPSPIIEKFEINQKSPDLVTHTGESFKTLEDDLQQFLAELPISKRPHRTIIAYDHLRVSRPIGVESVCTSSSDSD